MKTSNRNTMNHGNISLKRLHASTNQMNYMQVVPQWLNIMYNTSFFEACMTHPRAKKKDLDHFCIDCLQPICSNCLPQHVFHKHIKIRRYVYSDVINRQDLCKLFNCSGIQTYHTNKAKVVFLKQRHQQRQKKNNNSNNQRDYESYYRCIICHKSLQDNSLYCSVACKVLAICGNECKRKTVLSAEENEEERQFDYGKDECLGLPFSKRRKIRRKGVPLRAPMF